MNTIQDASNYTLVIVDMQGSFKASRAIIEQVKDEVALASKNSCPIVVLQYQNRGRTHDDIMRLIESSGVKHSVLWKSRDDGSAEVSRVSYARGYPKNSFRVCGVNTHACVRRTVVGLTGRFPTSTVNVATAACNGPVSNNWKRFPRHRNIKLIMEAAPAA